MYYRNKGKHRQYANFVCYRKMNMKEENIEKIKDIFVCMKYV